MTTFSNNVINQKLENKTLLLRVDLNVPVLNGKVLDYSRIKSVIPSIKHIIKNKVKWFFAVILEDQMEKKIKNIA